MKRRPTFLALCALLLTQGCDDTADTNTLCVREVQFNHPPPPRRSPHPDIFCRVSVAPCSPPEFCAVDDELQLTGSGALVIEGQTTRALHLEAWVYCFSNSPTTMYTLCVRDPFDWTSCPYVLSNDPVRLNWCDGVLTIVNRSP